MDKEKFLSSGLIDLYVLGLASEKDVEIVHQYAETYPDIKETINSLMDSLEQYARANSVDPPVSLKENTFAELDQIIAKTNGAGNSNGHQVASKNSGFKLLLGAGVLLLAVLGYALGSMNSKYNLAISKVNDLNQQLADCQDDNRDFESKNQIFALQNEYLKDDKTIHVHLRGTPNAPQALAVAYWNEEEDYAYLNILDLPKPASNKQYQLWADVEGEMISMGVLDFEKEKLIKIPHIAHAESLNITLERYGGAQSPDVTQIFMSGKV
jgi:anti-sigma-K factor RskA